MTGTARGSSNGRSGRQPGALLLTGLAAVIAGIAFAGIAAAGAQSPADPEDPEQVARGERIYAETCASCHGDRLEGQPDWRSQKPDGTYPAPPHDEEGHTWHHPDSLLFRYTKLGGAEALEDVLGFRSGMPGFGDRLSDHEIWDVLAYIKSHWPEEMREYQRRASGMDR